MPVAIIRPREPPATDARNALGAAVVVDHLCVRQVNWVRRQQRIRRIEGLWRLREVEVQTRRHLAEVETRLAEQETVLERLRTDPAYVEMVIRRRLGYAKPDEFVFRFDE